VYVQLKIAFFFYSQIIIQLYFISASLVGDWLQGPHVYALYESYNMTKHQIELLFIAGFGSSLLFGTIVGSFADK
jgi:MFS transporter, MFS domain-containing protein family, molybdate-anion transporter